MKKITITKDGKETVKYEFETRELELLSQPLPPYPCNKCQDVESCCGCSEYEKYSQIVDQYQQQGLYSFAYDLRTLRSLKEEINSLQQKHQELQEALPEQLKKYV